MITLQAYERSPKMSEIKAVYRSRTKSKERTQILEARTAVDYLREVWNKDTLELTEDFLMVCLNTAHQAIGWVRISSGGFDSARVDLRVVFSLALQAGAAALIFAHNHPSGLVEPSEEDKRLTRRLKEAGGLLGIQVLDHIILGKDAFFSFAENVLI
jgi:DNA repair protein RadC